MQKIFFAALCILLMLAGTAAAADDTWITIDPVQQPKTGEPYIITGSTNIPDDTAIVLKIYQYDAALPMPDGKAIQNLPAAFTTTMIVNGDDPIRSWSVNGPNSKSLSAGNYGYVATASLMYQDDELLAVASLPKPEFWAAVYPIPDRTVGDAVRISGTTNIAKGDTVLLEATQTSGQKPAFQQRVTVDSGDDGGNTWTVVMDTAGFSPGTYAVTLNNVLHQQGPVFRLNPMTNVSPWWISFDPLSNQPIGVSFTISGATNFAAGTPLDIVIKSSGLSVTGPEYPKAFTGTATVQEGEAGINFWSIAAEIQSRHEDEYEVTVTEPETKTKVWSSFIQYRSAAVSRDGYWITMNEVRTSGADDPYIFSGSTTVPLGTSVTLEVCRIDATISGTPEDLSSCPKIYRTSAVVIRGENGVNHWAIQSALTPHSLTEPNVRYAAAAFLPEMPKTVSATRTIHGSGNWTTVDAVDDAATGDVITLSGTTNLPPGEWITVEVYKVGWGASPEKPDQPVFSKEILIESGSVWSAELDTTDIRMGKYTVVAADAPYLSGPVFSLTVPERQQWIAVDPIPFVTQNSSFTLSGTTGLGKGMHILIEVLPRKFVDEVLAHDSKACYSIVSGTSVTTTIVQGEDNVNIWNVPIDTRNWVAETYVVKVTGIEVDVTAPRTEFDLYPENFVPPKEPESPKETQAPGFAFITTLVAAVAALIFSRK